MGLERILTEKPAPPAFPLSVLRARWLSEPLLVGSLVVVAAVIRWVDLWTIPIFTDEGDEIGLALRIFRDGARPLTNDDPYLGPLFNYLLAGAFWIAGPSPWLPRGLMLVLGTLTICVTYLLARELCLGAGASRGQSMLAGGLAGGLLAVNAAHVLVISHVAWGNCVTPLFTTTAGWLLARAARTGDGTVDRTAPDRSTGSSAVASIRGAHGLPPRRGLILALACGVFGLALQTHPSVAALLPGVGLYVLWQRWRWLLTPWPYLGALALLAAQAPTLIFIAREGLGTWLGAIHEKQEMYERDGALSVNELVARLEQAVHTLGLALGGLLNDRDTPLPPVWHPAVLFALGLAVLALVWLVRGRQALVPLVVLSGLVLLPVVNGKYAPLISNARYLMPLTIVLLTAVAAWAAGTTSRQLSRGVRAALPAVAVLVLLAGSAASLAGFSIQAHREGRTNARLLASLKALDAAYRPDDVVSLDRAMYRDWSLTEGRLLRVYDAWLDAQGVPHRVVDVEDGGRLRNDLAARGGLAILANRTLTAASRGYQIEVIATDAAPGATAGSGYSIVRLRRSSG